MNYLKDYPKENLLQDPRPMADGPIPFPGMGGYQQVGSDRYAVIVVGITRIDKKTGLPLEMYVHNVHAERTDSLGPWSETQNYQFALSDSPTVQKSRKISYRKNGTWVTKGTPMQGRPYFVFGKFDAYRDPHF